VPLLVFAQDNNADDHVIYKTVPKKLKIKDKIIIENNSPYYILQMVVAIPDAEGKLQMLGSASYIAPNETFTMSSFKNNWLKNIRNKQIAIKIKGAKLIVGEQNQTQVWTPYGSVGVGHKELDPEVLNNIKPSDITYNFDVSMYENRHDLYLQVITKDGDSILDF